MNNLFNEILKQCKDYQAFKRISANHPLDLYLGYNEFGKKTLALITDDVDLKFQSTKQIEVKIADRKDGRKAVKFSLMDDTETDLFYRFCEDIYDSTRSVKQDDSLKVINNRWNSKKFVNIS